MIVIIQAGQPDIFEWFFFHMGMNDMLINIIHFAIVWHQINDCIQYFQIIYFLSANCRPNIQQKNYDPTFESVHTNRNLRAILRHGHTQTMFQKMQGCSNGEQHRKELSNNPSIFHSTPHICVCLCVCLHISSTQQCGAFRTCQRAYIWKYSTYTQANAMGRSEVINKRQPNPFGASAQYTQMPKQIHILFGRTLYARTHTLTYGHIAAVTLTECYILVCFSHPANR